MTWGVLLLRSENQGIYAWPAVNPPAVDADVTLDVPSENAAKGRPDVWRKGAG